MKIVKPVYDYLKFQRQKDKALNTLKANGNDLRTYWQFLKENGYEHDKVTPNMIADFIDYLRMSDNSITSIHTKSARATLYNNAQLKERVLSLRTISKSSPLDDVLAVKEVNNENSSNI